MAARLLTQRKRHLSLLKHLNQGGCSAQQELQPWEQCWSHTECQVLVCYKWNIFTHFQRWEIQECIPGLYPQAMKLSFTAGLHTSHRLLLPWLKSFWVLQC